MVTGTASPAGADAADPPGPGPGVDTDQWRRRLLTGPDVVPSATTLRFASLVLAVLASTGSLYGYMALLVHTEAETRAAACMKTVRLPGVAKGTSPMTDTTVVLRCTAPYLSSITLWSLTGTLLVVVAMMLAYAVTPWCILHAVHPGPGEGSRWSPVRLWRRAPRLSRRGLHLLRDNYPDQAAVAARVEQLAERIGLEARRRPRCHLNPYAKDTGARAFGYQRRTYLILHLGLLKLHRTDPAAFDGTVLHELAHLTNRDNRPTYLTYAAWRAYLVLVVVPFLAAFFAPGVFLHPADPGAYHLRARLPDTHSALSLVLLTGLVYLTRNAVLRVRETHADARAALTDAAAVLAFLRHGPWQRGGRLPEAVGHHPSAARRLRDVRNSAVLYRPGATAMFAAGMAIGLIAVNLGFSGWIAFLTSPRGQGTPLIEILMRLVNGTPATVILAQVMVLGPAAAVALLLIAGMACVTMWRARLGVAHGGKPPAPWRAGLALATGVLAALPLSVIYANAGTWGVFGDGAANTVIVVVLTSLTLAVIVIALFQWAAEAAAAWIPVSGSSLRRGIAASVILGTLGAAPVFFTWFAIHGNVSITWVQTGPPAAFIRHWPLAEATVAQVVALNYLSALPGCAILMALPVLYVAAGAARRSRTTAPAWARAALGPDARPIRRPSVRARLRVPLIMRPPCCRPRRRHRVRLRHRPARRRGRPRTARAPRRRPGVPDDDHRVDLYRVLRRGGLHHRPALDHRRPTVPGAPGRADRGRADRPRHARPGVRRRVRFEGLDMRDQQPDHLRRALRHIRHHRRGARHRPRAVRRIAGPYDRRPPAAAPGPRGRWPGRGGRPQIRADGSYTRPATGSRDGARRPRHGQPGGEHDRVQPLRPIDLTASHRPRRPRPRRRPAAPPRRP